MAQNLDWQGRAAEADGELTRIVSRDGPMKIAAIVERGYLSLWHGRYRSARAAVADLQDPIWDYWRHEIEAECLQVNGELAEAEHASRRALAAARKRKSAIDSAAAVRHLARIVARQRPGEADALVVEALEANERTGSRIGLGQTLATKALGAVGRESPATVVDYLEQSRRLITAAGHRGELAHPGIVEVFLWCAHEDWDRAAAARESLENIIRPLHHFPHWSVVSAAWLAADGRDPRDSIDQLEWLDDPIEVARRWCRVLAARRMLVV